MVKTVYEISPPITQSGSKTSKSSKAKKIYGFVVHTESPENKELRAEMDKIEGLTVVLLARPGFESDWAMEVEDKVLEIIHFTTNCT